MDERDAFRKAVGLRNVEHSDAVAARLELGDEMPPDEATTPSD